MSPYQKRRARREFWQSVNDALPLFLLIALISIVRFVIAFA